MKEKYFKLEIVTPFQIIYQDKIRHVRMPGTEGSFGVLAGHAPLITTLGIGEIKVELKDEIRYFATSGGIIEVLPYTTTVLVETAEEASQIDVERATSSKKRAQKRLKEKSPDTDMERAKIALQKAVNRLKISKKS